VRSIKEVFLHIAYGNQLLLNIADNSPSQEALGKQIEENTKGEHAAIGKQEVIDLLTKSFADVRKLLEGASAGSLTRNTQFFNTPTTRRGMLTLIDTHMAEHLGQAIAYARMNGIVPPWSK
jgi:uncharacterized damage-inducible protein DinB